MVVAVSLSARAARPAIFRRAAAVLPCFPLGTPLTSNRAPACATVETSREAKNGLGELGQEIPAVTRVSWLSAPMSGLRHFNNISIDGHFSAHGMPDQTCVMSSACGSTR